MKDATARSGPADRGSEPGAADGSAPRGTLRPAIVQAPDGRVLMLGYMDRTALRRTLEEGRVTFYSRSRERLWTKGETSGHWLETLSVHGDCDGDALLVAARPHGPTCHTGARSCFDAGETLLAGPAGREAVARGDPRTRAGAEAGSGSHELGLALDALWRAIARRDRDRPADSYTAELLAAGTARLAQKLGEEGVETALAAVARPDRLPAESADILYHLLVLWRATGVTPAAVAAELAVRRAPDGDGIGEE